MARVDVCGESGSKRGLAIPKKPYGVDDVRVHSSAPSPCRNSDCSTEMGDLVSFPRERHKRPLSR